MSKRDPIDHALHVMLEEELGGRTPPDLCGEILARVQAGRPASKPQPKPRPKRLERGLLRATWAFVSWQHRKWWLLPMLIAAALVGLALAVGTTGAAPFIYTMF